MQHKLDLFFITAQSLRLLVLLIPFLNTWATFINYNKTYSLIRGELNRTRGEQAYL